MLLAEKHYFPSTTNVHGQVEPFLPSSGIHSAFSSAVAKLTQEQTVLPQEHSSRAALMGSPQHLPLNLGVLGTRNQPHISEKGEHREATKAFWKEICPFL